MEAIIEVIGYIIINILEAIAYMLPFERVKKKKKERRKKFLEDTGLVDTSNK